jgi:hypothetical protein
MQIGFCWDRARRKETRDGARKRTRTSTTVRPLAPEASASANSAIRAQTEFYLVRKGFRNERDARQNCSRRETWPVRLPLFSAV